MNVTRDVAIIMVAAYKIVVVSELVGHMKYIIAGLLVISVKRDAMLMDILSHWHVLMATLNNEILRVLVN